jgi:hypothetical protein
MTKKEYLMKLFDVLEPHYDFVVGLRILIRHDKLNDEILDSIFQIFSNELKKSVNIQERRGIEHSLSIIQKIKETEKQDLYCDTKELESIFLTVY